MTKKLRAVPVLLQADVRRSGEEKGKETAEMVRAVDPILPGWARALRGWGQVGEGGDTEDGRVGLHTALAHRDPEAYSQPHADTSMLTENQQWAQ